MNYLLHNPIPSVVHNLLMSTQFVGMQIKGNIQTFQLHLFRTGSPLLSRLSGNGEASMYNVSCSLFPLQNPTMPFLRCTPSTNITLRFPSRIKLTLSKDSVCSFPVF